MGYALLHTILFKSSDFNSNFVWILDQFNIDAYVFIQWVLCVLLILEPCSHMIQAILKKV